MGPASRTTRPRNRWTTSFRAKGGYIEYPLLEIDGKGIVTREVPADDDKQVRSLVLRERTRRRQRVELDVP
jgi:hypothetical protein